jgi:hypothetical protein
VVVESSVLAADGAPVTIAEALRRGMGTLSRSRRVVFAFYAATTVAALLITAPVFVIGYQSLGDSAWAHEMTGNLDASWPAEMFAAYGAVPWAPVTAILMGAAAISAVVYLFLLGGALQVFCTGESFFAGCGRNFWRLVRLTLVSLVFYGGAWVVYRRVAAVGRRIWGEGSEAGPLIHWSWFSAAVCLCLLALVNLVFDYARVMLVIEDQKKTVRATIAAWRFVWRNFARTGGVYAVVCGIAVLCLAAYLGISHSFAQSSIALVILLLVVRQVMVVVKIWSRLLFCTTAIEMYTALRPAPPVVVEAVDPPVEEGESPAAVQVALAPALGINAFEFITAWNNSPECRAAAEASLLNFGGASGVVFDPGRLLGRTAVLSRLAGGADSSTLQELVRRALHSEERPQALEIREERNSDGSTVLAVDVLPGEDIN